MNRDNWFLVVPTILLGVVASYTLYQLHAAGDVRRAVGIVVEYEADGQPSLAEYLGRQGLVDCDAEVVSNFYGTMDVTCKVGRLSASYYVWRVDVIQKAFAPADGATREMMSRYQPSLYSTSKEPGS